MVQGLKDIDGPPEGASLSGASWHETFDLVVLGSGAAGLTAALVAVAGGQRVLVIEKTGLVGGTTAYSAGTCWIPGNRFIRATGIGGDAASAGRYLDALVGPRSPHEVRSAFLDAGPQMLDYLETRCGIGFRPYPGFVDYHPEIEGAALGGRALEPLPFDGRRLGPRFDDLRWPVPEWGLLGGKLSVLRSEVTRLLRIAKLSPDAIGLAVRLGVRYAMDRLRYRRGTRLVLGNALVASLYHQVLERGGAVRRSCTTRRLIRAGDRVTGVEIERDGAPWRIRARSGIVLAGGGFPASPVWRSRYLRHPAPNHTRAAEGAVGDTIVLGEAVGGVLGPVREDNALWFPSSIGRRRDGSTVVFPHIWDRAKPGLIAVDRSGRRFTDESVSYHQFTRAMYAASEAGRDSIPATLVCDRRFLWRYGLGMIRPMTPFLGRHIRSGYLSTGRTLAELAARIGVDPAGLQQVVAETNRYARTGVDEAFGKGSSPYGRQYGDPNHRPNPCLGPIETGPFFAVSVVPTPLATAVGLKIDALSRVLDDQDRPIDGLYACGSDAQAVMGGEYPGGGAQIGVAMTFGFIAARHAVQSQGPGGGVPEADDGGGGDKDADLSPRRT